MLFSELGYFGDLWLNSFEFDIVGAGIVVVDEIYAALFLIVDSSVIPRSLLHKSVEVIAAFEKLADKAFMGDVSHELARADLLAVAELEMLNEEGSQVKLLTATKAGKLLVDFMRLWGLAAMDHGPDRK